MARIREIDTVKALKSIKNTVLNRLNFLVLALPEVKNLFDNIFMQTHL